MDTQELAQKYLIFKCISGSMLYGTNTEISDVDHRGVFIAPPQYSVGCMKNIEQVEVPGKDEVIYEFGKFVHLAVANNPNIVELLAVPSDCILNLDDSFKQLMDNINLFLSKKCRHTYAGYGWAQIKRIKSHERWISNPQPETPPLLRQFCTVILQNGWSGKLETEKWKELSDSSFLVKTRGEYCFRIYSSSKFQKGFVSEDGLNFQSVDISQEKLDENNPNFIGVLIGDIEDFKTARKQWNDYWEWNKNRNVIRAGLEAKMGYDCYSADTQFLTKDGWKYFDQIGGDDRLATLNQKTFRINYQKYIDRHDAIYTGKMHNFIAHHTNIRVTGNHRMFLRPFSRNIKVKGEWGFRRASYLPHTFDVVNVIKPLTRQYKHEKPCGIDMRLYLKLMGWYIAEGTIAKRLVNGNASVLSLSQLKGGRMYLPVMRSIAGFAKAGVKINTYSHFRKSKNRMEMIWTIPHREISNRIVSECGDKCENKRLPRWVFSLSKRMKEILLEAMHVGDGHDQELTGKMKCIDGEWDKTCQTYYTSSPQLADDVQELAFLCGFETSKWGPYDHGMYHVHIRKTPRATRRLTRNLSLKTEFVQNERIVCFTVPDEILVTRRKGEIAIHGNSKHAMHLVRLLKQCVEILTLEKIIVKRPDAKELLAIRNGSLTYEELIAWAEDTDKKLEQIYETSTLRHSPDIEAINKLTMNIRLGYWRKHGLI